ncbi:hypothetical protein ACM26W_17385 [Halomonas sp. HK25]|uniref:hypothetical protein n=1 Tax=Halomonas sp. HK25 TaxID=3394321 RepID=UPI0039FC31F7
MRQRQQHRRGACGAIRPAEPISHQSLQASLRPKSSWVLWELGSARRMETEGLLGGMRQRRQHRRGACGAIRPAEPISHQSLQASLRPKGSWVLWELGFARRMETEGLLGGMRQRQQHRRGACGAIRPAEPISHQSLQASLRPKGSWVLWELGFARRMETEGLLAACASAGNTAGAPAAPFARQSRSPTSRFKRR